MLLTPKLLRNSFNKYWDKACAIDGVNPEWPKVRISNRCDHAFAWVLWDDGIDYRFVDEPQMRKPLEVVFSAVQFECAPLVRHEISHVFRPTEYRPYQRCHTTEFYDFVNLLGGDSSKLSEDFGHRQWNVLWVWYCPNCEVTMFLNKGEHYKAIRRGNRNVCTKCGADLAYLLPPRDLYYLHAYKGLVVEVKRLFPDFKVWKRVRQKG
jgi:predicted SprT family Zn-dependent metalloprotease